MLTIENRPAMLGESLNTRTEKHGDEHVPAHDIQVEGIMLDETELNALLGAPGAHAAFFERGSKMPEPTFPRLKSFVLKDKFEGSTVTFAIGLKQTEVRLEDCKVSKLTLTPMPGGLTQLDCQVQALSTHVGDLPLLVSRLGRDVTVEIELGEAKSDGKGKQQDLAINTFGEGEEPQKPKRGRRRKNQDAETLQ